MNIAFKRFLFIIISFLIFIFVIIELFPYVKFIWFNDFGVIPREVPVKLDNPGVVADFKFEIKKSINYKFVLMFYALQSDKTERERVQKIIGKKEGEPGEINNVRLSIYRINQDIEEEVFFKETSPFPDDSWPKALSKTIGGSYLAAGKYRARLENLSPSPIYATVPISFEILGKSK